MLALLDFFCPDCRYFGWRETITHTNGKKCCMYALWNVMLFDRGCKSFSLLLYQYGTYSMAWKKKQHNSTVFWCGVSCMYSSASVSNTNQYISALPIISIIEVFVIFLIEDTALKTCQCRSFVPHNQCRHLFLQCSVALCLHQKHWRGPLAHSSCITWLPVVVVSAKSSMYTLGK